MNKKTLRTGPGAMSKPQSISVNFIRDNGERRLLACSRRQLADDTIKSLNTIQKVLGKLPSTAGKAACAPRIRNKSMFQRCSQFSRPFSQQLARLRNRATTFINAIKSVAHVLLRRGAHNKYRH